MKRAFVIACVVFSIVGCGGDKKPPYIVGHKGDAGAAEGSDASVAVAPGTGPALTFTTPVAAQKPDDEAVITSGQVTVRCQAKPGPKKSKVLPDKVAITLENDPEDPKKRLAPATTAVGNATDEYEAKFDVSSFPNGELHFHCVATDAGNRMTDLTLTTLLDLG